MVHYVEAIRSHGAADGYNTEASERLHIDYAKEGYRASNKKDYIKQMTVWLGRQEAVNRFHAYLVYAAKHTTTPSQNSHQLDSDSDEDLDNHNDDLNDPTVPVSMSSNGLDTTGLTTHSVSLKPAYPHLGISNITMEFKATNFLSALTTYIRRAYPPPAQPLLPSTADRFYVYKRVNIVQPPIAAVGQRSFIDRIRATPAVSHRGRLSDVPAHFDFALIQAEEESNNEVTKGTYLEGEFFF